MPSLRIRAPCLIAFVLLGGCAATSPGVPDEQVAAPPNLTRVSERLTTSGQPSAHWFDSAEGRSFNAVVHLWSSSAGDLPFNEAVIVGQHGQLYIFQAIDFSRPNEHDLASFLQVMRSFKDSKVLVHCQLNLLSSSMVFLYEAIDGKRAITDAFRDVERIWFPNAVWRNYLRTSLAAHQITFEPY